MLLPSLQSTTDDPLRNTPKLLVPPIPMQRRSSLVRTSSQQSPTGSIIEQMDSIRQSSSLSTSIPQTKPTVDEITEILRERRQRIKRKK